MELSKLGVPLLLFLESPLLLSPHPHALGGGCLGVLNCRGWSSAQAEEGGLLVSAVELRNRMLSEHTAEVEITKERVTRIKTPIAFI
jgi:hypothetical protein